MASTIVQVATSPPPATTEMVAATESMMNGGGQEQTSIDPSNSTVKHRRHFSSDLSKVSCLKYQKSVSFHPFLCAAAIEKCTKFDPFDASQPGGFEWSICWHPASTFDVHH